MKKRYKARFYFAPIYISDIDSDLPKVEGRGLFGDLLLDIATAMHQFFNFITDQEHPFEFVIKKGEIEK